MSKENQLPEYASLRRYIRDTLYVEKRPYLDRLDEGMQKVLILRKHEREIPVNVYLGALDDIRKDLELGDWRASGVFRLDGPAYCRSITSGRKFW